MDLYFIFLVFCLVGPVYSSFGLERFIKIVNGPIRIECNNDSFIVTNDTNYMKCNGEKTCYIKEHDTNTYYACLREIYKKTSCNKLPKDIPYDGCFVGDKTSEFTFEYERGTSEFLHIFVLQSSTKFATEPPNQLFLTFSNVICTERCEFTVDEHLWILVKNSQDEEDFSEFFVKINQGATTKQEKGDVYEKFMKTTNDSKMIKCDDKPVIVTNQSKYMKQNDGNNKKNSNVQYFCLEDRFEKSKCKELCRNAVIGEDGCYVGKDESAFYVDFSGSPTETLHIFLLQSSIYFYDPKGKKRHAKEFCYLTCNIGCTIKVSGKVWILVKISNNTREDFDEFFKIDGRETKARKKESKVTELSTTFGPTKRISSLDNDTEYPTTMTPTDSHLQIYKSTEYSTTMAPMEGTLPINKVLVAVVVIMLVIMVFMFLICYRKRLKNSKKAVNIKLTRTNDEFPLSENQTTNQDQEFNARVDCYTNNALYGTTQSEVQSPQRAEGQLEEQQYAQLPEFVYADIDHGEGLENDSPPGGPRHIVIDGSFATGAPRHVVVNGELYATITKEEEPIYMNSCHPDDLIREEVNGEMYTFVKKRKDN